MRNSTACLLTLGLILLLVPLSNALASPVLVWPQAPLANHEAALNLTSWFAESLGLQIDTSREGEWHFVDEGNRSSILPEFLQITEIYVLPLVNGTVKAQYVGAGILRRIEFRGNSSYVAESDTREDLEDVAVAIASDLALEISQSSVGLGYEILYPLTPQEQHQWWVSLRWPTDLGDPSFFNTMDVTIRVPDLRAVTVILQVRYDVSDAPEVSVSDATAIALEIARTDHNATDPLVTFSTVTVRNGTSFVYILHVGWEADNESSWSLQVWVDATTGEVLFHRGPQLSTEDYAARLEIPWIPVLLVVSFATIIGLVLFHRLRAERALDQFTRGRIYGYVQAYPGVNYTQIQDGLGLKKGTLTYHLWVLERLGFVRSVRQRGLRQLYPKGAPFSKGSIILSRLQYMILDLLNAEGQASQADIARGLGISRQRVHYNVKVLRSLSLIQPRKDGSVELSVYGAGTVEEGEGRQLVRRHGREFHLRCGEYGD